MSNKLISIELLQDGVTVVLRRSEDIESGTWLQVRSQWGSLRKDVARELYVPLEQFLSGRRTFASIVQRSGIRVSLDDSLKPLVEKANADNRALDQALSGLPPLEQEEIELRLAGSRFTRDLRSFQYRDLGHLLALSHGANFSVMGAGKTTVALATYEAERQAGRVQRLLVIGPLSAFGAWIEEAVDCFVEPLMIQRFDGTPIKRDTELLLVNYHRLSSSYDDIASWVVRHRCMVLLDEAHRMKRGWKGQWGTACLNLAYLAQRREILTGTPAPQSPRDFVALLDYVWPTQALRILPSQVVSGQASSHLNSKVATAIAPLFVRTTKAELELPPIHHEVVPVPLAGLQRDIYLALRNQYAGQFAMDRCGRSDFLRMGRIVMYMLEAATNPKLLVAGSLEDADPDVFRHPPLAIPEGSPLPELLAQYNEYEVPAKIARLAELVKENADEGKKTLVWSNFVRNLKLLRKQFAAYMPAVIHGGVPPIAPPGELSRETEIGRFRNDPDCLVLLANPAAMSEGISLHHECHDAIYLDRTFNAGQYLQSVDRIHRLGLEPGTQTNITFLLTDETIDMTVDSRVRDKAEALGAMLDDPNLATVALPDDEDYGPPIDDVLDVEALFRHLRGEDVE